MVSLAGVGFGGLETHVLQLSKQLLAHGYQPLLLVGDGSLLHQFVVQEGLEYCAARWSQRRGFRHLLPFIFDELCQRYAIKLIHCNNRLEVAGALRAARRCSAKVLLNYHVSAHFDIKVLEGLDAFVSPSFEIAQDVSRKVQERELAIKHIAFIPPLFDAEKFLTYRSDTEPGQWFFEKFRIAMLPCPIISVVGNMVPDLQHKNYPLLFEAMAILIQQKNKPVQAVLAGDGPMRPYLEQLAGEHRIRDHVHFLGYTVEHTPGVLYHSDMFVLASSREAFGIVYLEAGLMHKPAIGAKNTGAETVIVQDQTGLLFENGSASSLASSIERLLDDPARARTLGDRAYHHVIQKLAPSVVVEQYKALYRKLGVTEPAP